MFAVAVIAIGLAFDEGRSLSFTCSVDGGMGRSHDGMQIIPAADGPFETVSFGADGDIFHRHLEVLRGGVGVEVIFADIDDRQLVNSSKVERFVKVAPAAGPLP